MYVSFLLDSPSLLRLPLLMSNLFLPLSLIPKYIINLNIFNASINITHNLIYRCMKTIYISCIYITAMQMIPKAISSALCQPLPWPHICELTEHYVAWASAASLVMTGEVSSPPFPLLMSFTHPSTALQLLITVNSWVTGLYNLYKCLKNISDIVESRESYMIIT